MRLLTFLKFLRLKTEYHEMMRYEAIQSIGFNSTGYQDIQQQKRKGNNGRMYGLCWSTQLSPDEAVRFESLVVHDDAVLQVLSLPLRVGVQVNVQNILLKICFHFGFII